MLIPDISPGPDVRIIQNVHNRFGKPTEGREFLGRPQTSRDEPPASERCESRSLFVSQFSASLILLNAYSPPLIVLRIPWGPVCFSHGMRSLIVDSRQA